MNKAVIFDMDGTMIDTERIKELFSKFDSLPNLT